MTQKIHVAVGLIKNSSNQYLISKRHTHLHQGGLWEFPGGKVEVNEITYVALCRELDEELNIAVKHAEPLLRISYCYPDKHVCLDVWLVDKFTGVAQSSSGQAIQWVSSLELSDYDFPLANKAILNCIQLPVYYAITGHFTDKNNYIEYFKNCLNMGIKLIQLRSPTSDLDTLVDLSLVSKSLCDKENAKLLVNADADFLKRVNVDGIHLNTQGLFKYTSRPIHPEKILAASVHNIDELQQAIKIEADFIVVSPVLKTTSHPKASTLGWDGLENIISYSSIPVFALGGMQQAMLSKAKDSGAFGLAAISEFWNK